MSNLFYSAWLVWSGGLGWATHHASFPTLPVEANINLCSLDVQNDAQFNPFEPRFVYAYIETPETPTITLGGVTLPNANKLTDTTVWLTTDNVTFQLEVQNVTASGVGMVHDSTPAAVHALPALRTLDLAVHDEEGSVVGTHREVQLAGGTEFDIDQVQELVLARAQARSDRSLRVALIDPGELPAGRPFSIDPRTGRPTQG